MTVVVLALVALAAAAAGYVYYHSYFEQTGDARVVTQATRPQARLAGKVMKVFVRDADVVKAGQPLIQLDPSGYRAAYEQRENELARSEKQLEGGRVYLARLRDAIEGGGDAARKKYEGGLKWFRSLEAKTQKQRLLAAEAQAQLKSTLVTAPGDGHVARSLVQPGAQVAVGQPLIELAGNAPPSVVAMFPASRLEKMKAGGRAVVFVPSLGKTFEGSVESLPTVSSGLRPPDSLIERVFSRLAKGAKQEAVTIVLDPVSIAGDLNRFTDGAAAEVKVYVK
ncbi:MAG: biotin/lipoyl-binding protein [Deltaproteobacteria bacterium]|nr:biotin/lipoyl-binding protein [Deltaproteobacteria bacterium]